MLEKRLILSTLIIAVITVFGGNLAVAETLRVGLGTADFSTLDPHRATATQDVAITSQMFNGLVRFPPGSADPSEIVPDLAKSWERKNNGTVWIFHLRQGVKFHHNFGVLTAEDVVYSLKRSMDPNRSSFASDFSVIKKVEALDSLTVSVTLKHPVPSFLGLIANYHGGMIVSKAAAEKYGKNFGLHPVGTGPFMYVNAVAQQYVQLEAFPEYFRGVPSISNIKFQFISSTSSRSLAFRSGELDLIYGKREQVWVKNAKSWNNAHIEIFAPGEYRTLHFNMSHEPLNNSKVRKAIAHAINIDNIVLYVGENITKKGCSVVPPEYLGADCSAGTYGYDPALTKKLLAEAGFSNGLRLSAVVSSSPSQQPIMEIIQAQLANVGIDLEINLVDHPTYHQLIRQDVSDLVFYGAARFPVADTYLSQFYDSKSIVGTPTAVTNFSHCNVADGEIRSARNSTSEVKRLKLWALAQQKIHDAVCSVPLFSLMQVWVRSNALQFGYDLKGSLNLMPPITVNTTLNH